MVASSLGSVVTWRQARSCVTLTWTWRCRCATAPQWELRKTTTGLSSLHVSLPCRWTRAAGAEAAEGAARVRVRVRLLAVRARAGGGGGEEGEREEGGQEEAQMTEPSAGRVEVRGGYS